MTVPYAFGAATSAIPLSQLDSNFNTPITLGNTAIQLGNTVTTLNNMTLANVTISSGNVTITNVTVTTANATTVNTTTLIATTANVTTGNVTNLISGNVTLTGGSITGTPISGSTGSFTTLTTSSTVTLNGGTANGVAYLNASNVLTTGSALTFDGTNLTVPAEVYRNSATSYVRLAGGDAAAAGASVLAFGQSHATAPGRLSLGTSGTGTMNFDINGTEGMRLTSTGLGIGTSSPSAKLGIAIPEYSASATAGMIRFQNPNVSADSCIQSYYVSSSGSELWIGANSYVDTAGSTNRFNTGYASSYINIRRDGNIAFGTNTSSSAAVERMRLDSSGNLGLGVTPSTWASGWPALQVGTGAAVWSTSDGRTSLGSNIFVGSGPTAKYIGNGFASSYTQLNGVHSWNIAPNNTSGAGATLTATQAMTLDASGNLLVGTTSASFASGGGINVKNASTSNVRIIGGSSTGFDLSQDTGGNTYVYNRDNGFMAFATNNTERARITSGGDLKVGLTGDAVNTGEKFSVYNASGMGAGVKIDGSSNYGLSIWNTAAAGVRNQIGFYDSAAGGFRGSITTDGTNTAYNTSSDYRLKDNQQPLTGSGAFIDALQPKIWDWKETGKRGVGFIAHEVQAVSPGSVVGTKDAVDAEGKPVMQAMEYGSAEFIANIVAELQSLRARVAQLESKGA